jgi:hypothetical protein
VPYDTRATLPDRLFDTAEGRRLKEIRTGAKWRRWGPYLSERQWGTVREDYSPDGTAWDYLPHDHARSRAYRWGEDGIGGWGDNQLRWCLSVALWNGKDPILKERLFGLTNSEGNHGEDVKELYYYLDGLPSHAYMRMLYKYPQAEFPYSWLLEENRRRGMSQPEFELVDTGLFNEGRYFDVAVEYAKADTDDTLMRVTVTNHGPEAATLHLLPQLWSRNVWSWTGRTDKPLLVRQADGSVRATRRTLEPMRLDIEGAPELLFCENETNSKRLFGIEAEGPFKDGINDYVVHGRREAVNVVPHGTKLAAHYTLTIAPKESRTVRLRFRPESHKGDAFADFDAIFAGRIDEADEFYAVLQRDIANADARLVQRQALAGMLWSKQLFYLDIPVWLDGDPAQPKPPESRKQGRNRDWRTLNNLDILSMPDAWEYPWYASWDLAFHCVTFALIDPDFAKDQLILLTREWYMHPNGQLPAYEWAFGDVNPPVHAWAAWRVYQMDRAMTGVADRGFLVRVFHKLMINFTWWVNRKDAEGRNIFQGGFLGLDNIGIFDRSNPLPTGGYINQSDGTAWMAMYSLNLMRISLELAKHDHAYEDIASKFFEHFLYIADAMANIGGDGVGLWDEQDQFYYDMLNLPGGRSVTMRVRSMVGLIPLFAVEVLDSAQEKQFPGFAGRLRWFLNHRPKLAELVSHWGEPGVGETALLSLLRGHRIKMTLRRMLDETEFLSDYGVRALSKYHGAHPYALDYEGNHFEIGYVPGESVSGLFGGNSNWRGPIWMPVNYMLVEALREFHQYYGEDFTVECPIGSGRDLSLREVADEIARRLTNLFLRDKDGRRACFGDQALFQNDPEFRDHLVFNEYFHGDTGRGVGASHQNGWTGLVALLLQPGTEAGLGRIHGSQQTESAGND